VLQSIFFNYIYFPTKEYQYNKSHRSGYACLKKKSQHDKFKKGKQLHCGSHSSTHMRLIANAKMPITKTATLALN